MALDTLAIVRRLEAAGIDRQQAEAIADVLRESEVGALADLATKADLREVRTDVRQVRDGLRPEMGALEQRLQGEIGALRAEMEARFDKVDARFESLEQRMTIKLGSMIVVALSVMTALVKLL
jgi:hypothetical protein